MLGVMFGGVGGRCYMFVHEVLAVLLGYVLHYVFWFDLLGKFVGIQCTVI